MLAITEYRVLLENGSNVCFEFVAHLHRLKNYILKKEKELPKISKEFRVNANEIAYIGDDINDLEIMKRVGLSAAPSDSIEKVRKMVDYVCISKGGEGAFREVADIILSFKSLRKN